VNVIRAVLLRDILSGRLHSVLRKGKLECGLEEWVVVVRYGSRGGGRADFGRFEFRGCGMCASSTR